MALEMTKMGGNTYTSLGSLFFGVPGISLDLRCHYFKQPLRVVWGRIDPVECESDNQNHDLFPTQRGRCRDPGGF